MKILFVCSGNTCRSPMAEVYLRSKRPEWSVSSVGVSAVEGRPASKHARKAVEERGLDLSQHRSRHIKQVDLAKFDKIFAMAAEHLSGLPVSCEAELLSSLGGKQAPVRDPFGADLETYRKTLAEIGLYLDAMEYEQE